MVKYSHVTASATWPRLVRFAANWSYFVLLRNLVYWKQNGATAPKDTREVRRALPCLDWHLINASFVFRNNFDGEKMLCRFVVHSLFLSVKSGEGGSKIKRTLVLTHLTVPPLSHAATTERKKKLFLCVRVVQTRDLLPRPLHYTVGRVSYSKLEENMFRSSKPDVPEWSSIWSISDTNSDPWGTWPADEGAEPPPAPAAPTTLPGLLSAGGTTGVCQCHKPAPYNSNAIINNTFVHT